MSRILSEAGERMKVSPFKEALRNSVPFKRESV
jgi:hypothetical protein